MHASMHPCKKKGGTQKCLPFLFEILKLKTYSTLLLRYSIIPLLEFDPGAQSENSRWRVNIFRITENNRVTVYGS